MRSRLAKAITAAVVSLEAMSTMLMSSDALASGLLASKATASKLVAATHDARALGRHLLRRHALLAAASAVVVSGFSVLGVAALALRGGDVLAPAPLPQADFSQAAEPDGGAEAGRERGDETRTATILTAQSQKPPSQGVFPLTDPTSVSQLLSMALVPGSPATPQAPLAAPEELAAAAEETPTAAAKNTKEPNLAGLAEIPIDLIWNRSEKKDDKTRRNPSFAAYSEAREDLPWDMVEPIAFAPLAGPRKPSQAARAGVAPGAARAGLVKVSGGQIGTWLKGKATKIKGTDRAKALYHFVLWLEPPAAMKAHVAGVSYDFSSPAVRPQSQASSDSGSGFKINAAGLACADEITVTLRFNDGRVQTINVDGCKLFDKA